MKSKAFGVVALLIAATLGACQSEKLTDNGRGSTGTSTGSLDVLVRLKGLAASDVSQVKVSIASSDTSAPVIAPVVLTPGDNHTYAGTFEQLPVSTNGAPSYDLTAEATDADGAVMFRGTATGAKVAALVTGRVVIESGSLPRVFTVTPTAPVTLANVAGVDGDGAPGYAAGSIKATGVPKAELYFQPSDLFGHAVTLGDVARMSFWTKKGTTHVADVRDWFLAVYTTPYPGQTAGWYGARIGAEPYLAANLDETPGAWNLWSTDGATDQLRFFESTNGYFGSYDDPSWSDFVAGCSLTGSHTSTPVAYAAQEVLYFSVQTASSATGFDGQLDGVRIELTNGEVVELDMQPSPMGAVFNTIPSVLPPNLPSQPFQAQQTAEFGDVITLAPDTGRHAAQATVVMVTWSTDAYTHPITLNLYSTSGGALTLIGTRTQAFDIPARPAGDPSCPDTGYGAGFAWKASDGRCYNGFAFPVTFDLTDVSVVLPDTFAYGIAYDTDTWGYEPVGQPGPYDSLNVAVIGDGSTAASTQPSLGTNPDPGSVLRNYWSFSSAPQGYTGFVPETGWTGYAPAVEFFAY